LDTKKVLKKIGLMSALLLLNITYAQKTISGNILDNEDGSPIPGANVFILGSSNGTASDFDGNFSFNTSKDLPIEIEISSLGYTTQVINITSLDQE
jgi:hypothetical protein